MSPACHSPLRPVDTAVLKRNLEADIVKKKPMAPVTAPSGPLRRSTSFQQPTRIVKPAPAPFLVRKNVLAERTFVEEVEKDYFRLVSKVCNIYLFDLGSGGFISIPRLGNHGCFYATCVSRIVEHWFSEFVVSKQVNLEAATGEELVDTVLEKLRKERRTLFGLDKILIDLTVSKVTPELLRLYTASPDGSIDEGLKEFPYIATCTVKVKPDFNIASPTAVAMKVFNSVSKRDENKNTFMIVESIDDGMKKGG